MVIQDENELIRKWNKIRSVEHKQNHKKDFDDILDYLLRLIEVFDCQYQIDLCSFNVKQYNFLLLKQNNSQFTLISEELERFKNRAKRINNLNAITKLNLN